MRRSLHSSRRSSGKDRQEELDRESKLSRAVAAVWGRSRQALLERVELLEAAAAALEKNALPPQVRERAHDAAHKLAGALGCFGLHEGTAIARHLEQALAPGTALEPVKAGFISRRVADLRLAIESAPAELSEDASRDLGHD